GSLLTNPQVLMTAAGLAWGLIESLQGQAATAARASTPGSAPPMPAVVPAAPLPPLPVVGQAHGATSVAPTTTGALRMDALRLVRLAVSAAHADGAMNDEERAVLERAAVESGAT